MFAAMASVAFASCVKNEPAFSVAEEDAIVFNSPVMGVPTKGVEMGKTYTGKGFTVYGWYHTAAFQSITTATAYMKGVAVTAENPAGDYGTDGTGTYRPETAYYWPKNGKLSFVAYSPTEVPDEVLLAPTCSDPKTLSLTFTASVDPTKQVDLMYSDWAVDRTSSVGDPGGFGGVDIVFNHALSVIYVDIKAEDDAAAGAIKLKSVTLGGVQNHGTINLTPDTVHSAKWALEAGDVTYTLLADKVDAAHSEEISKEGKNYANYIVMPQQLDEASEITIEWYLKHGEDWLEQTSVVELKTAEPTSWERNKRYFYTITMGVDAIYFAPRVTDWVNDVKQEILSK